MNNQTHKYLINLPDRQERLFHSLEQLRKVDLDDMITIVKAVSPEEAQKQQFSFLTKQGYQNIKNPQSTLLIPNYKALGCSISHQKCWSHMVVNNIEEAFIMEDDILVTNPDFFRFELEQVREIIKDNSSKATFILFNGKYIKNNYNYEYDSYYSQMGSLGDCISPYDHYSDIKYFPYINYSVIGCHFYYLNLKMATFLVKKLKHISYQIDIEISNLAKVYNDHIFLNVESSSIIQSSQFPSDIQFYSISKHEISYLFNLNIDISNQIWNYLLPCFRR